MTKAEEILNAEYAKCANGVDGFVYFSKKYARIPDRSSTKSVPFILTDAQLDIISDVFAGKWVTVLKARQIGITTLFTVYALWLMIFQRKRTVVVLNQSKDYANDFLGKVRSCYDLLPTWLQPVVTTDQRSRLGFNKDGHGSSIISVACSKKAARSLQADLVIFDEHAFHKDAKEARRAAEPTLEGRKGVLASISTSDGPQGDFFELYSNAMQASKPRYTAKFYSWKEWSGRTQEWYDETRRLNAHDPLMMAREYPESWEEAFQAATGRVYPLFRNVPPFIAARPLRPEWKRYRAVDWGAVDAFVCLWGVEIEGTKPGLSIDPSCKHTIREMLAYMRDEHGKPKDVDNHAPDALRYMVVSNGKDGLRGHLHIYRELWIKDSAAMGLSVVDLGGRVKLLSAGEDYEKSVADLSRPDSINLFRQMGIPFGPHRKLKSVGTKTEIEQGIDRVNALITSALESKPLPAAFTAPIVLKNDPFIIPLSIMNRACPFV